MRSEVQFLLFRVRHCRYGVAYQRHQETFQVRQAGEAKIDAWDWLVELENDSVCVSPGTTYSEMPSRQPMQEESGAGDEEVLGFGPVQPCGLTRESEVTVDQVRRRSGGGGSNASNFPAA